jgi:hypothetical protein
VYTAGRFDATAGGGAARIGMTAAKLAPVLALLVACGGSAGLPGVDGSGGGGGGDSGSASDDRLDPLAVGRSWTYDVTSTYASCPAGSIDTTVLSAGTTDGRATFEVSSFCGETANTSIDGDRVDDYYDWGPTGWMRALDEPVEADHTWTTTNGSATFTMTYSDAGTVAGHPNCWQVTQNVSYTTYWIYCRGVGLVTYDLVDLAGGTIHAELSSTSF